jgi:hypothetical protein
MVSELGKVLGDIVLVALLPGFLAARVRDLITDRSETQVLASDIVRAMMYWLPILAILWAASKTFLPALEPFPIEGDLQPLTIIAALVAAVPVGAVLGIVGETRAARNAAYRLHVTRKTWKTPWMSAFLDAEEAGCWAAVWLEDGTGFQGWARYTSDDDSGATIYLSRVEGREDGAVQIMHPNSVTWVDVPGIGVLLPPTAKIAHIDFSSGSTPSAGGCVAPAAADGQGPADGVQIPPS